MNHRVQNNSQPSCIVIQLWSQDTYIYKYILAKLVLVFMQSSTAADQPSIRSFLHWNTMEKKRKKCHKRGTHSLQCSNRNRNRNFTCTNTPTPSQSNTQNRRRHAKGDTLAHTPANPQVSRFLRWYSLNLGIHTNPRSAQILVLKKERLASHQQILSTNGQDGLTW